MKKKAVCFICVAASVFFSMHQAESAGNASYHVTSKMVLKNTGYNASKAVIVLPVPQSNEYQEVKNLKVGSGKLLKTSNTGDFFAKYTVTSGLPKKNSSKEVAVIEYDVTLHEIIKNPDDNAQVVYDKNSADYKRFTAPNMPYINPTEPRIQQTAEKLWREAGGKIVAYARKAYEYTAFNFTYQNAYTGIHPVTDILNSGGADCGNLSSIFISLCRAKGIPARHCIAYGNKGMWHAWAEFHAGKDGWVPVDVTYKNANRNSNFFGRHIYRDKYVIVNNDLNIGVESEDGVPYTSPLLQTHLVWRWGSGDAKKLEAILTHTFTETQIERKAKIGKVTQSYPDENTGYLEVSDTYAYGVKGEHVYFSCKLTQDGTVIEGTQVKTENIAIGHDPAYWKTDACHFTFKLDILKTLTDSKKPVEAEITMHHSPSGNVMGVKKMKFGMGPKVKLIKMK